MLWVPFAAWPDGVGQTLYGTVHLHWGNSVRTAAEDPAEMTWSEYDPEAGRVAGTVSLVFAGDSTAGRYNFP